MEIKKKILICGSIGFGGIKEIKKLQLFLRKKEFSVIDQMENEEMDYSNIIDFRERKELSEQIIKHDLECIDKADIIIIITDKPSFGTGVEQYYAFNKNKHIILLSEKSVPTPWPIYFSSFIVKSKENLVKELNKLI